MINPGIQRQCYPFISSSTMELAPGVKMPLGVIYGAILYPRVEFAGYLFISRINFNSNQHTIVLYVADRTGETVCQILVDTKVEDDCVTGFAFQNNEFCGCIKATKELLSVCNTNYKPSSSSFIFTPSVIRPRRPIDNSSGYLKFNGERIYGINWDTSEASKLQKYGDQIGLKNLVVVDSKEVKITKIEINNKILAGESVCITSAENSGIRIETDHNSEIKIGRLADL